MNDATTNSAAVEVCHPPRSFVLPERYVFWLVVLAYIFFTVVLGPLENWKDIIFGMRFGDTKLAYLPFTQGSFFFFAFIINSDSVFRAIQHQLVEWRLSPFLMGTVFANVGLLAITWADYSGLEDHAAHLRNYDLPVSDQAWLAVLAVVVGYIVHHAITSEDLEIARSNTTT